MTSLIPRCAKCRRHLRLASASCPFCAKRSPANSKGAALAVSLMAFGYGAGAGAQDVVAGDIVMPSEHAFEAQVEPHYGLPPRPRPPEPPPEEEPEPPTDDED